MNFCCGTNAQGNASAVSALKCTLMRFASSTGTSRSASNLPIPTFGVPAKPVAAQNIRYRGTAAYETPRVTIICSHNSTGELTGRQRGVGHTTAEVYMSKLLFFARYMSCLEPYCGREGRAIGGGDDCVLDGPGCVE